jgi:hypothetical protein
MNPSEASADPAGQTGPDTSPRPPAPADAGSAPGPPWPPLVRAAQIPERIRRGRPLRLLIRAAAAAALSLVVLYLIPRTAAAPADVFGLIWWFVLTGRKDLAPPPER